MKHFYTQPEVVMISVDQTQIMTMHSGLNGVLEEVEFSQFRFE